MAQSVMIASAVGIFIVVLAFAVIRKIEAAKHFKYHGLPIEWRNIIIGRYYWSCACGHPAYYTGMVGAGAVFKSHTLIRGKYGEPPPYCHKCLREIAAICVCEKVILPEDKVALALMHHVLSFGALEISFLQKRIVCEKCASKMPGDQIFYEGIYSAIGTMPIINEVTMNPAAMADESQITHAAPAILQ